MQNITILIHLNTYTVFPKAYQFRNILKIKWHKHNILDKYHLHLLKEHSTHYAIITLVDEITKTLIDNGGTMLIIVYVLLRIS